MEKFTYNSKTVKVPSCLDEVSSEQYRQFLILAVLMNRGTISPGQFRVKWLSFLLGMKADYAMYRCEIIRGICAAQERWRHVVVVFFKHGAFPFPDERGAVYPFRGDLFCQSARKVIVVCALHLEGDVVTALIFNAAYAEIMSVCRDIASQCSK